VRVGSVASGTGRHPAPAAIGECLWSLPQPRCQTSRNSDTQHEASLNFRGSHECQHSRLAG
jgi:hypothetical protein